jgi:hypothetical protein
MKKGEKKKQQKALARRKERKSAQQAAHSPAVANPGAAAIRRSRHYPLIGCWAQAGWEDAGLAAVVVARRQPDGLITFGSYVVDYYCLGVKDCWARADASYARFTGDLLPTLTQGAPVEIGAATAHELIYGSIEYAARWGFRPHPDFKLAQMVLDPPGQQPRSGQVTFGKDGKPLFVSGPYDNAEAIMRQLMRTAGEGNFDYMVFTGPPDFSDDDDTEYYE